MGRKSSAVEKRAQIVTAFCDCAAELGIENASMGVVAAKVGIDRSTMHYYFPSREEMVVEAVRHMMAFYVDRIEASIAKLDSLHRARSLVELLLGPGFHDERRSRLLDEMAALSNRVPFFQEQMKAFYVGIETAIVDVFDASFPHCDKDERRAVAYTISQLADGVSVLMGLGFSKTRRLAARQIALRLVDNLADAATVPGKSTAAPRA